MTPTPNNANPNILGTASLYPNIDTFDEGSGVDAFTKPEIKPLLGSTDQQPVHIKVKKDPESFLYRALHVTQSVVAILFFLILILTIFWQSSSPLNQQVTSHHQVVIQSPFRFSDVHGCDEIKQQLVQVVEFLKTPSKYEKFGASMPRGYLLEGPPGVGKTLLAKAVAGEANVPFLVISGAEFDEVYVGVGAARVRALFKQARSYNKAVIFIDEIDAVAGKRGEGSDHSRSRQTLNQLLVEMDGFRTGSNIVVLGATNSVETLDPALLRPGRFDKTLTLMLPDIKGRTSILENLLSKIPKAMLASDVKAADLASTTIGYSGAELAQLVNQAKMFAAIESNSYIITKKHFEKARNFISLGPETARILSAEDKERTAYHEAGHAIVGLATPHSDPIQHATIVPHSNALGLVMSSPDKDVLYMSLAMLQARIDMTLGGFLAEEALYGSEKVSTGASSDLKSANSIARYMVTAGFGSRTGFLQPLANPNSASELAKQNFESDCQDILLGSRDRVRKLLKTQKAAWKAIAKALIEKETLSRAELEALYKNNKDTATSMFKSKQVLKAQQKLQDEGSTDHEE